MPTQISPPASPQLMEVQVPDLVGMEGFAAKDELHALYLNSSLTFSDPTPRGLLMGGASDQGSRTVPHTSMASTQTPSSIVFAGSYVNQHWY